MDLIKRACMFDNYIVGPSNRSAYDACMDAEVDLEAEFDLETVFACEDILADAEMDETCDATVGEIDACVKEMLDWVDEIAAAVSCDSSLADFDDLLDQDPPPACAAVEEKCPEMAGEIEIPF